MAIHVMALEPGGADAAIPNSAQEFRNLVRDLASLSDGFAGVAQGCVPQASQGQLSLNVTAQGTPNMTVNVATGRAIIVGDDITNQGLYHVWVDSSVNTSAMTIPPSGTYNHRVCLQVQDKLSNGVWTGYTAAVVVVLGTDTGGAIPAEPASAITLAVCSVTSAQSSIGSGQITDYREKIGPVGAYKASATTRSSNTTLADDPALQLMNLASNATYEFFGNLCYKGGTGASEGDFEGKFRADANTTMFYSRIGTNASGNLVGSTQFAVGDQWSMQTQGTSTPMIGTLQGIIVTGAAPALVVFQWAQQTSNATGTTLSPGSFLRARRLL
jgi:hypothetical protein